jgi:membrane protein YqaA with SNARE-associated domain
MSIERSDVVAKSILNEDKNEVKVLNSNSNIKFDVVDSLKYVAKRVVTVSSISSVFGTCVGYYIGGKEALYFYTYGIAASGISITYFSGAYLSKIVRQKEDPYNFAISGAANGAFYYSFGGIRRCLIGTLIGSLIGFSYGNLSTYFYTTSRQAWLNQRRYTIQNSKPRALMTSRQIRDNPTSVIVVQKKEPPK